MQHDIWSMIAFVGLAGWIAAGLFLAFQGFPARDQLCKKPALKWGVVLIISYVVWVVGLLHA